MRSMQDYPMFQDSNGLAIALSLILERFGELADMDELAIVADWRKLTAVSDRVTVAENSDNPGWPLSNDAILEFERSRIDGHKDAFYCAVADAANWLIIDSRDGTIKRPGDDFGEPVASTTYLALASALRPMPAGAFRLPSSETYSVLVSLKGYLSSGQAAARGSSNTTVAPGKYSVYNKLN